MFFFREFQMSENIGYIVTDGQFQDGGKSATKCLFTGGILVPEHTKSGLIYTKIKEDLFARVTAVNAVKSHEILIQDFQNMFEISFDNGESPKYKGMKQEVRERFKNCGWWSLEEVIGLKAEYIAEKANTSQKKAKNAKGADKEEGTKSIDKPEVVDNTVIGAEVTLSQASDKKINVKFGEGGPTICIDGDKVEDIVDDSTGAIKALVNLVPKLLESNATLNREVREEKTKAETARRDLFTSSTTIISSTAKIRDLEESIIALRKQMDGKDSEVLAKEATLKQITTVLKDDNLSLKETVLQIKSNTEIILRVCGNPKHRNIAPDGYCEALNLLNLPIEMFLSDRSNDRLTNSNLLDFQTFSSPNGHMKVIPAGGSDVDSFICSVAKRSQTDIKGLAIFLLEVPKNLCNKPLLLRKHKIASFVDAVRLLVDGISSQFKSPVYVALMPCQESDLNEAKEIEKSLSEALIDDMKLAAMNTKLDRSHEAIKMIVSSSGRARGLSVIRTIAEMFKMMLENESAVLTKPVCSNCGALCEADKCMCIKPPMVVEVAEQPREALDDDENEEAPAETKKFLKNPRSRISYCWVCGGSTSERPHVEGRPCTRIALSCSECKAYGHDASCHWVTVKDAKEEMRRRYGINFRFTTRPVPAPTTKKRTVVKTETNTEANTEAKKLKKEVKNLESDED